MSIVLSITPGRMTTMAMSLPSMVVLMVANRIIVVPMIAPVMMPLRIRLLLVHSRRRRGEMSEGVATVHDARRMQAAIAGELENQQLRPR